MKKKLFSLFFLSALMLAALPAVTFAQAGAGQTTNTVTSSPLLGKLKDVGTAAGYDGGADQTTFLDILGTVISAALGLLGIIFIILMLVAGFNWMTAAGDEEKIKKAGSTIRAAIIGLLIVISAYAIWSFINYAILDDGSGPSNNSQNDG